MLVLDCDGVLSSDVARRLDSLLQRAGSQLRVVLLSREDPLLPLHRYRLAGTLTELRMADLGFTRDEARAMLTGLGVDLSESAMDAMIGRTQGWAAGLRMAAMSLAHRADREEAARKLAGDTGTVAEYLLAEVLDTQPAGVRQLLLETSVVDVLRPGLATALAGPHADRALSFLVHGNAFLEELPEGVGCYRYHDLFRQLLRAQLAYESPERWVELHEVAAAWFAAHDLVGEAARHAVLVEEWDLAARYVVDDLSVVVGPHGPAERGAARGAGAAARGRSTARRRPIVNAARSAGGRRPQGCGRGSRSGPASSSTARAAESWPAAELALAVVQLVLARQSGDPDTAFVAGAAAQALLHMQDPARVAAHPEIEAVVEANLAARACPRRPARRRPPTRSPPSPGSADVAGREHAHIDALGHGALLAAWSGDLTRAADLAVRAIRLSSAVGLTPTACPGAAEVALAYVDTERYDLAGAREHARACRAVRGVPRPTARRHARPDASPDPARGRRCQGCAAHARRRRRGTPGLAGRPAGGSSGTARTPAVPAGRRRRRATSSTRDGRTATGREGGDPAAVRDPKLRSGNESSALRDLDQALRLAAPEQSRRVFREAPDELWQLLRRHDELWRRHAWLTDRRPSGEGRQVPQPRSARAGAARTTGRGSTSR